MGSRKRKLVPQFFASNINTHKEINSLIFLFLLHLNCITVNQDSAMEAYLRVRAYVLEIILRLGTDTIGLNRKRRLIPAIMVCSFSLQKSLLLSLFLCVLHAIKRYWNG